jgi:hypothetical protein
MNRSHAITVPHAEYQEGQVRRFLTVLFMKRAQRHLRTLATLYGWSPDYLAAMEARFLQQVHFVPQFLVPKS